MAEYSVAVVGVSLRQPAIRRCQAGNVVDLIHELGNVFDRRAIAVRARGQHIGYLPKGGWMTDVLLDEKRDVKATIASISPGGDGQHLGVVLNLRW